MVIPSRMNSQFAGMILFLFILLIALPFYAFVWR